jgi:transcriptional regulator with XRE-family HTH domain
MEMKVDPSYIRDQRERRAWSQAHLAEVTDLGLRTIQRIEKTGTASYESARSLAAVLGVDVAELRDRREAATDAGPRISIPLRPLLGAVAVLITGGALLLATTSFADQVLMDITVSVSSPDDDSRALQTQILVDDGAPVPNVENLQLGDIRFSIMPRVRAGGLVLLEVGVFERRGNEEVVLSQPRLLAQNGEPAEVRIGVGDGRTLQLSITAQVDPPAQSPTLRGR